MYKCLITLDHYPITYYLTSFYPANVAFVFQQGINDHAILPHFEFTFSRQQLPICSTKWSFQPITDIIKQDSVCLMSTSVLYAVCVLCSVV